MAKLNYDSERVDQAIQLLQNANTGLASVDANLQSAVSTVTGARGIEYVDCGGIMGGIGLGAGCSSLIEQTVTAINSRVNYIQEYNAEVEGINPFIRTLATVGLGLSKFAEGVFGAGEQIVDGAASALGFIVGLASKNAQEKIGNWVKEDHVGNAFKNTNSLIVFFSVLSSTQSILRLSIVSFKFTDSFKSSTYNSVWAYFIVLLSFKLVLLT